jgi:hypothetical protein
MHAMLCRHYLYYLIMYLDLEPSEFRARYVPLLDELVSQRMQERWPLFTPQEWYVMFMLMFML